MVVQLLHGCSCTSRSKNELGDGNSTSEWTEVNDMDERDRGPKSMETSERMATLARASADALRHTAQGSTRPRRELAAPWH